MIIGVPKETHWDEQRVAIIPAAADRLIKQGHRVLIEKGAGETAGYPDEEYASRNAELLNERSEVFENAEIICQVRLLGLNPEEGAGDLELIREDQTLIGFGDPLAEPEAMSSLASRGANVFSVELVPRITRAQSMDALSSMALVAGYRAVILAAEALPKLFPMFMTAAGTVAPAKVLVIGAGVAGLQAIAIARKLGAVVSAYDVRPVVKEQVESLGASFVELGLETADSESKSGYAKELGDEFYKRQREVMTEVVAESDVVITTAAIPGKPAPILVTADMVGKMALGSVIVDIAAERGGNCELTQPGEEINAHGVSIIGPLNIASALSYHASQLYSQNLLNFLSHIIQENTVDYETDDEIVVGTLVCRGGRVVHPTVRELLEQEQ